MVFNEFPHRTVSLQEGTYYLEDHPTDLLMWLITKVCSAIDVYVYIYISYNQRKKQDTPLKKGTYEPGLLTTYDLWDDPPSHDIFRLIRTMLGRMFGTPKWNALRTQKQGFWFIGDDYP